MTRKHTKRALLTSALALILCLSMLVGTTFAWFTDSVTSGQNNITAGNLDVELYHSDRAVQGEKVTVETILFDDVKLWEPGAVAYENLQVKNEGNLALKYQLKLNFTNATKSPINDRTLADVLQVAVVRGGFNGGRAEAELLTYDYDLSTFALEGELREGQASETFGIVIYWKPAANDNDFNMNNDNQGAILEIDLGVDLYATQLVHEHDSFDNTYDADLEMPEVTVETPTADLFLSTLAAGKTAVLNGDLVLDADGTIPAGVTAAIDLNGYTLTTAGNGIAVKGNLIVSDSSEDNSGAITVTKGEDDLAAAFVVSTGGVLNIQDGKITVEEGQAGILMYGGAMVMTDGEITAENGYGIFMMPSTATVTISDGKVSGNPAITQQSGVSSVILGKDVLEGGIAVGSSATMNLTYQGTKPAITNDGTLTTVNEKQIAYVTNTDELKAAINNGATEITLADGSYTMPTDVSLSGKSLYITGSKAAVIDLKAGTDLNTSNANLVFDGVTVEFDTVNYKGIAHAASVTYKNCAIKGLQFLYAPTVTFEHCTLDSNGGEHCVWTYAAQTVNFTDCDFTYGDRCINAYADSNPTKTVANFTDCTFTTSNTASDGAVEINSCYFSEGIEVNMTDCTAPAYGEMVYVSKWDSTNGAKTTITVDGKTTVANATMLANAVAAGATDLYLMDGEYDVYGCANKTLTINGSKDVVLLVKNDGEDGCDYAFGRHGLGNVTFNGVTIDTTGNTGNYKGYAYMKGTFNDCNFVGAYSLNNNNDFEFNRCTFDFKNGYFWTWDANSVTFNTCTFNGNSKCILAHGTRSTVININNCTFAATEKGYTGSGDNTACVEMDPVGANTYTVNFTGTNTKTDSYAGWTRVKDGSTGHTVSGV